MLGLSIATLNPGMIVGLAITGVILIGLISRRFARRFRLGPSLLYLTIASAVAWFFLSHWH
jgi:hypothetical protein